MTLFAGDCELTLCSAPNGTEALVFSRPTRAQNSAAEIVLSFASALSLTVQLDPEFGAYPRLLHGVLTELNFTAYAPGNPDVRVADRTTVCGASLEVINVLRYPTSHVEIALRYVR